jgi:hypothetical protein
MAEDESDKTEEKANEEIKKTRIDIVASAKSLILWFLSKIWGLFLKFGKWVKNNPNDFLTLLLALGTFSMALFTWQLSGSNKKLIDYTHQANERAEKLFVGQNKPLIDVAPIGIIHGIADDGNKMCATLFSVVNYSGFVAYNIVIDVAYEGNVWILEWLKAEKDRKEKEGTNKDEKVVVTKQYYPSISTRKTIKKLKPGETREKDFEGKAIVVSGSLDLEERVVSKGKEGFPVFVRVTWENDRGHVFDEIHEYTLTCTKGVSESGRAFTFIPKGIISQRNLR